MTLSLFQITALQTAVFSLCIGYKHRQHFWAHYVAKWLSEISNTMEGEELKLLPLHYLKITVGCVEVNKQYSILGINSEVYKRL
jgi:hypothetical protein